MTEALIALVALTTMEIVLGIDNVVFIAVLSGRLPAHQQAQARRLGLGLAMVMRILLLLAISWIMKLDDPLFTLEGLGLTRLLSFVDLHEEVNEVSIKDLILLGGGLFLIAKSVHEIHIKIEGADHKQAKEAASLGSVIAQVVVLDLVFSLDSVITAVGMANDIPVMVVAMTIAMIVMLFSMGTVAGFVEGHPSVKILALAFLLLIGVMLMAEGLGQHVSKGYIYFAMAFSLFVELLNLRYRKKTLSVPERVIQR